MPINKPMFQQRPALPMGGPPRMPGGNPNPAPMQPGGSYGPGPGSPPQFTPPARLPSNARSMMPRPQMQPGGSYGPGQQQDSYQGFSGGNPMGDFQAFMRAIGGGGSYGGGTGQGDPIAAILDQHLRRQQDDQRYNEGRAAMRAMMQQRR